MNSTIQIYTRNVYGRFLVYVFDSEQAANLVALTGSKTLESRHVAALENLGFTFVNVPDPKSNR